MAHYKMISCHVLWHEICYYTSLSKNKFDFEFLRYSLHLTPEIKVTIDGKEAEYIYDSVTKNFIIKPKEVDLKIEEK